MRSGWHAEWDAYVASAPARAEIAARREAFARFAQSMRAVERAWTDTAVKMGEAARQIAAAFGRWPT